MRRQGSDSCAANAFGMTPRGLLLALLAALSAIPTPSIAAPAATSPASVTAGGQLPREWSRNGGVSADGRFVVFESKSGDIVPEDTNMTTDVFVRDRVGGTTERVSVAVDGSQAATGGVSPVISGDGSSVLFYSGSELVPSQPSGLFLRDRTAGTTMFVANGIAGGWDLSGDGRYIVYIREQPGRYIPGTGYLAREVMRIDRATGEVVLVSIMPDGSQLPGPAIEPTLSDDGGFVAFGIRDLCNDCQGNSLFIRDVVEGTTERVNPKFDGGRRLIQPVLSANGDALAFVAIDLLRGTPRVVVYGRLEKVIVGEAPGGSLMPSISGDGAVVAFSASLLNAEDANFENDVFTYDIRKRILERVSMSWYGGEADGPSFWPNISDDGLHVAFESAATDLILGDTNGMNDVFVRDRGVCDDGRREEGVVSSRVYQVQQRLGPAAGPVHAANCATLVGRNL